jgi:hypothetical protein
MQRRRGPNRAGFIFLFGWRTIATRTGDAPVRTTCPACQTEADFVGVNRRQWFTLFFLPIIPMSTAQPACRCENCKAQFNTLLSQMARRGTGGGGDWSHSIALYNKVRENPSDGAAMLQLLQTYEAMSEPAEAEAAARHFPQAVDADPRCKAVLERLRQRAI